MGKRFVDILFSSSLSVFYYETIQRDNNVSRRTLVLLIL